MTVSALLHKRKALLLALLFVAFSAFTTDVLDLREDLRILSCPYSSLDNNVSTGLASDLPIVAGQPLTLCPVYQQASNRISFLHLLPYGYRAPPSWS
jgi:hypothetical protein